jgi:hypothetical protein
VAAEQSSPQNIDFRVEMGPSGRVRLNIRLRGQEFPLDLPAQQMPKLGVALLAAGAAHNVPMTPPEGTVIHNCHFPVVKWGVGYADKSGMPILAVEIAGGGELVLLFDRASAQECGETLIAAANNQL